MKKLLNKQLYLEGTTFMFSMQCILKLRSMNNLFCENLIGVLCVWNEMIYYQAGIFIAMQLKSEIDYS